MNVEGASCSLTPPDGFGAARSATAARRGAARGTPPAARRRARDPLGFAEGALRFALRPRARRAREVRRSRCPSTPRPRAPRREPRERRGAGRGARSTETRARWRARLGRVALELPPRRRRPSRRAARLRRAGSSSHRDGPRIQPGSRCYERSWIRDGALTGTALARDRLRRRGRATSCAGTRRTSSPDGRVPCCVDRRGVDRARARQPRRARLRASSSTARLTRDAAFLRELWPHVAARGRRHRRAARASARRRRSARRAARFCGSCPSRSATRATRRTPCTRTGTTLFAVRGLADAAWLARPRSATPRRAGASARCATRFAATCTPRSGATMERHGIDLPAGSVELGDFDPTATAIWLAAARRSARSRRPRSSAPSSATARSSRRAGAASTRCARRTRPTRCATPTRCCGSAGASARSRCSTGSSTTSARPRWRQWPEIVWRDPRAPRFLGDLPHGWIASTFLHALRRCLVYERDARRRARARAPACRRPGSRAARRCACAAPDRTSARSTSSCAPTARTALRVRLGGPAAPPGGIVLVSPLARPLRGDRRRRAPAPHLERRTRPAARAPRRRRAPLLEGRVTTRSFPPLARPGDPAPDARRGARRALTALASAAGAAAPPCAGPHR